jgi:hypothetical protein
MNSAGLIDKLIGFEAGLGDGVATTAGALCAVAQTGPHNDSSIPATTPKAKRPHCFHIIAL